MLLGFRFELGIGAALDVVEVVELREDFGFGREFLALQVEQICVRDGLPRYCTT